MWHTWCRSCGADIEVYEIVRTEINAICEGCREYYAGYVIGNEGENIIKIDWSTEGSC